MRRVISHYSSDNTSDNMERELIEQAALLGTREKYIAWEQRCDNFIESVEEQSRAKRPRLSIGKRQSVITCIARLESLKDTVRGRFVHVGAGYGLRWREIETAFESRILTGAVINSGHIEPRQFLENACEIVLKRVQDAIEKHGSVKVNTAFNGEFVAGDKHAIKSITTKNFELYQESNVHEWYDRHIVEPTLTSLDEFQERDSGWALSRILNLIVNVNKLNPMHAGCNIELPREIVLKKAVINVHSTDNACFAWSVVAALYPAERNAERVSSYPHYLSVLNLTGIEFPMKLKNIPKFERLNDVSINVYGIENKEILPLRLTDDKKEKHVNLLYLQNPHNDSLGHFMWIKNLSRLVRSQVTGKKNRIYFCDRCLHYFSSCEKLQSHEVDCEKMNDCAIRLFSDENKWLEFNNHCRKERIPFIVYADLECMLQKMEDASSSSSSYEYQRYEVFSIGYYVRCSYNNSLSSYHFRNETRYRETRFDTSDYPADNKYGMPLANKKVPGLMKDENNGTIMTEFVGLRAKMYALRVDGKKDTKKAKGVKSNVVARTITFDDYTRCLNEEIEMTRRQSCIRSKLHEVYTISESKIALSPYDDKRYVVSDSTETLPWGHWRIPL
ncbi:hypothetical protein ALC57_16451 [Trachymyrmex cornetzi]|uniref:C2H2-type domain-containing protein n=1 Tax=Trachymyrmex cornetzi TaxID=471704 RepID=A0A151IV41_9HYME|nr:hypothetical protein ALC57_16451 [Trachymyrmex cornetzi]